MKLQVNDNGSWRRVMEFDRSERVAVIGAARALAAATSGRVKWSIVDDTGTRKWLESAAASRTASSRRNP